MMMMSATKGDIWAQTGPTLASIMFVYTMYRQFVPYHLRDRVEKYMQRFIGFVNPYIQITFDEFVGGRLDRSEAYDAIRSYLAKRTSKQAKRLKADISKNSKGIVLSMDDHEEVPDEYQGVTLWWRARKIVPETQTVSFYGSQNDKRYYTLTFLRRDRERVIGSYLKHVLDEGKAITVKNRQRKLYTNGSGDTWYRPWKSKWSHVAFDHPATFGTLAMDLDKKNEIIDDLVTFSKNGDYYAQIGKVWKRGYLLYGPPGTGKSSMIAAMANLLNYDIYDLELTSVKDNSELRKLMIETSSKSIIVIEDIDCSLDLTGKRKKKEEKNDDDENLDPIGKRKKEESKESKVTLAGLLNFIDGLWSACGGERLIVFTTNHVDQLDPALIRKGRMDKHIEFSYCSFEGFKVLAKNYLDIDSHDLFDDIRKLLEETKMTPADVAEHLMLKTFIRSTETCLEGLIQGLKKAKEDEVARLKAEEEAKERELLKEDKAKYEGEIEGQSNEGK